MKTDTATRRFTFKAHPGEKTFDLHIFLSDYSLRYHTVKHFLQIGEWEKAWHRYGDTRHDTGTIMGVQKKLKEIGCPTMTEKGPVSSEQCYLCALFKTTCSLVMKIWEKRYIESIQKVVTWSLSRPLFADYIRRTDPKKTSSEYALTILSQPPHVFVDSTRHDTKSDGLFYSVSTAHYKPITTGEIRDIIMQKALKNPAFFSEDTWGCYERQSAAETTPWKERLLKMCAGLEKK